jgi:hypothetical protein
MCGGVVEVHLGMSPQPALGGFVFVNVQLSRTTCNARFGKASITLELATGGVWFVFGHGSRESDN